MRFGAAQVDGIDRDGKALGVEGSAGRELGECDPRATLVAERISHVVACVGIDPGDADVQGHGVVEQCVVGQHAVAFQDRDPVVGGDRVDLGTKEFARSLGDAQRTTVIVSGCRGGRASFEFRKVGIHRVPPGGEFLEILAPLVGGSGEMLSESAGPALRRVRGPGPQPADRISAEVHPELCQESVEQCVGFGRSKVEQAG
ncbi:Uncharacterised protein [Mycobacteroides abscessus subsp. abscessus]|nr:Uncharacterised protein [Mycobacteroides abscessus subsp. abscessus]